jgi:glutamate-5-semialdehyde dehydrogenase
MTATLAATADADIDGIMNGIGQAAKAAADMLAHAPTAAKDRALGEAAAAIRANAAAILKANGEDLASARARGLSEALLDRLELNAARVEAMARGLEDIAALKDPVGDVIAEWDRPNGLRISRVRTPLGVIGIIYESRPNVTADAGGLCLKAGNAAILRGGSEAVKSNRAIHACLIAGLKAAGLPEAAIQLVPTQDRAAVGRMLKMAGVIDVIVPRGGKSLVERVQREASVPVFAHLEGICHIYVDKSADLAMARALALNAKMRRTGVCGAMETLLVDKAALATHLRPILDDLIAAGCELRGDADSRAVDDRLLPACDADWDTEYLAAILAVRAVDGVNGAISHIARHGSGHTDSIIAEDNGAVARFLGEVNSAIVMHNASTQFADGGEFGMGAEIGISTGKMHARGPVGVEQLTSFKYIVRGHGQARP